MKIHLYFHLSDLIKQKEREIEREKRERNNKMWD